MVGCAAASKSALTIKTVSIPLNSKPEGAKVMVDGKEKGLTPMILKYSYSPDVHFKNTRRQTLRIEKNGYEPYVMDLSPDNREFEKIPRWITLKKQRGVIDTDTIFEKEGMIEELKEERRKFGNEKNYSPETSKSDDTGDVLRAEDWFEKGVELSKAREYEREIEAYKQAIKLKPDYVEAHFNLGLSYLILGDKDSAYDEYELLKNLDPHKARILYEKAILKVSTDRNMSETMSESSTHGSNNSNKIQDLERKISTQKFYTIQTGSFIKIEGAKSQFEELINKLNEEEIILLRLEKIGKFYLVRLGKFKNYLKAEELLQKIKRHIPDAIILNAYIKNERIIRSYTGSSKNNRYRIEEKS